MQGVKAHGIGSGELIDARMTCGLRRGTTPGPVNYPFNLFRTGAIAPEFVDILKSPRAREREVIGAVEKFVEGRGRVDARHETEDWDFTEAKDLVIWCNGPARGKSPRAMRRLLHVGHPGDRIIYCRGGMQMWQLTTVVPRS